MSAELINVARYALTGVVVGAAAAAVVDYVGNAVLSSLTPSDPSANGTTGRAIMGLTAGVLIAGAGLYAGDKVLSMMNGAEDPLGRVFFSVTAFTTSAVAMGSARRARTLMSNVFPNTMSLVATQKVAPPPAGGHNAGSVGGNIASIFPAQTKGCDGCK